MFNDVRAQFFPADLVPGVRAIIVDSTTFWQTVASIPADEDPFASLRALGNYQMPHERDARAQPLQAVYDATHREFVLFMEKDRCVGWHYGTMIDPSTFFMSYSAVIKSYQQRGIYGAFLKAFLPYLYRLGYERATSNHMVTNRAVLIAKLKAGFIITGTVLDERWGAQVSMAYFFHEDRREGFARAYSVEHYAGTPEYC
jgi:ribosomal protein S18 acetylase RimI-like enzyme